MITARTTRLVRVPDLHTFRQALVDLACEGSVLEPRDRLVLVPTRAAAAYLTSSIEKRALPEEGAHLLPDFITRTDLHARFADRLPATPAMLTDTERMVLMGIACRRAALEDAAPPFQLRAGLLAEVLDFYDTLQRNLKPVETFARLALGLLEPGATDDRGAARLVQQTQFLVGAFTRFEQLCRESNAHDEHSLRRELLAVPAVHPWRHLIVAVGDRAFDAHGLYEADWDLVARIPGLERVDVVTTDTVLAGAFHERIHHVMPGIEEVRGAVADRIAPTLLVPSAGELVHPSRDREEEVAGFARWVRSERSLPPHAMALVVRTPLPYVYVSREVLRSAGVSSQMFDALPLAAEPFAAALDLLLTFVSSNWTRTTGVALLRSPHFQFGCERGMATAHDAAVLDRALSEAGYLGDARELERLVSAWTTGDADSAATQSRNRAAGTLLHLVGQLEPLRSDSPPADHLNRLLSCIAEHERLPAADDPLRERALRGRAAVLDVLTSLRDAYARFDEAGVGIDDVTALIRRWLEVRTFAPHVGEGGVHIVDAASARFGDFALVQLAGLVEGEWPERPRRNIFYPPGLLRELGWPSEIDRLEARRSEFEDLLKLPSERLVVSTFILEDDALVAPSPLIDSVATSGLEQLEFAAPSVRIFEYEALARDNPDVGHLPPLVRDAVEERVRASRQREHRSGYADGKPLAAYSVSSLERYQDCPFKFFAADVLRLEEPLDDEPMRSPRARGRFIHELFQRFFEAWDARGLGTISVDLVDEARTLFVEIAEPMLQQMPPGDARIERARLFGSAVASGMIDRVLGLEASRPADVRERWLEYRLDGEFALGTSGGRRIPLRGVADRIDLLEGNRLRILDYKSGAAPNPKRALQVPVYAMCAQERLAELRGGDWAVEEASYLAFSGKRSLVPVVSSRGGDTEAVLDAARARLRAVVDGVEQGSFPPRPHDPHICTYCAFPTVCRKDYVGDE